MDKIIHSDILGNGDVDIVSVKFTLTDIDIEFLKKAKVVLSENAFLGGVSVDMNIDLQQFLTSIEDEEDEDAIEITSGDADYFYGETPEVNVYKSGGMYLKVCSKYDGRIFYEVEITL